MTETDWISSALNGKSFRKPKLWKPGRDDLCAGEVVAREQGRTRKSERPSVDYIVIRVVEATENGGTVEPDSWLRVACSNSVLAGWLERDDPKPGDLVAVRYSGTGYQREVVAGIARRADANNQIRDGKPW